MRITGGTLRGRKIACPAGIIRPAMDKMRESLFFILGNLEGQSFLDLFSGSGICAIEAASRGAHPVVLVEKDKQKAKTIFKNVSITPHRIECKFIPVEQFIKRTNIIFDIIYIDPPFSYKFHTDLIQKIGEYPLLKQAGLALIHRPKELDMQEKIGSMIRVDKRIYGRSIVDFYKKL